MWREYFGESCHVYGVDIEAACMAYGDEKTKVFIGDQADRAFWAKVRKAVPTIDILIDDGGHLPEQQRITLEEMLPHICSGGVYLCEDIHGADNEFAAYVQGLANGLNSATPAEMPKDTAGLAFTVTGLQGTIHSIHLYPFVAVIEKRERNLDLLIALSGPSSRQTQPSPQALSNPALIFRYGNGTVLASYGDSIDSLLDFDPNPKTALIETTKTKGF